MVSLVGATPAALELALVTMPEQAPAVVAYRPQPPKSAAEIATGALDAIEGAALDLFPAWLPDVEGIRSPAGAGVEAVRAAAMREAPATGQFGPFLADLAEQAVRHSRMNSGRFSPEVRAVGLAKVVARAYGRPAAALLVVLPTDLTGDAEQALVAGCEWLADRGGFGVWLTGAELSTVDRISTRRVRLPEPFARIVGAAGAAGPSVAPEVSVLRYPPVAGRPHPASQCELAVERALAGLPWAVGRAWNQTHYPRPLEAPVRLDLLWEAEKCVIEIDGPEHLEPLRYEADRRRDRLLQRNGYVVVRFTNGEVARDLMAVICQIEEFIIARRRAIMEGRQYARQG
ncbi:MAG TPA: DUF559 domain-containing protein [Micromonosporaceae bacterium]|nr:DUF559 domain-containing protein [Micromonosporaceae bacterium]